MRISSLSLITIFLISCGGGGGGGSAPSAPLSQNITVSLTSSANSAEVNSSITLTWSSTLATTCTASGLWSGSKGASGSESIIIGVGGSNNFSLSCSASGANSGSASITVNGLRYFAGSVFDGYIRGAEVFVDTNDNLSLDGNEASVSTDNQGSFTQLLFENGTLVSKGGFDLDTGAELSDLTLVHKLEGYEASKLASPFTTLIAYMDDASNINAALGIDASIDLLTTDPIPNLGEGIYDYIYEKGNQLTVLAYTLQNRFGTTSSQIYFQSIADQLEESFAASQQVVNIEAPTFISNVINKVETARNSTISSDVKANLNTLLVSVIPLLKVSTDANITTAVQRFAFSTLQNDVKDSTVMIGNASPTLLKYKNNVYDYVASDQGIDESAITPAINNAPSFSLSTSFTSAENQTAIGSVSASDPDGDSLTYSISGSEINISSSGVLTFAAAPDYETKTSYTATVTVSDGTDSVTQAITVTITDVDETVPNAAPTISSSATFSLAENNTNIGTVSATDADGDSLTYSISGSEVNISSSGSLFFASAPDYETKTSYTATVTVSDGTASATQTITVNVTNLNDNNPAITSSATFSAAENQTSIGTVSATDADGDSLTYSISGSEINISSSGVLTFATAPDYETKTSYTATVTVSDGINSTTQNITVNVTDVAENVGPVISGLASSVSVAENQTSVISVSASDANGDTLSYSLSGTDAASFSINSSGVITFDAAPNYESKNSYSITVQVSDGSISPSQALTVNVTNVNEAPIAVSQNTGFNFPENTTGIVFRANEHSDPDSGDSYAYSLTGDDASDLTIDSNGDIRFVSTPNYESPADSNADNVYDFNIVGTDSGGLSASANSSISVSNVANTWKQRGSDIDGDSNGHSFGYSVALSLDGNYLVAGDPRAPNGNKNFAGMVRVFYWDGSSWAQKGSSYLGEDQNDRNGFSVSISDDGQAISSSAPGENNTKGYGRVLEWDGSNYTATYGVSGNENSSRYPPSLLTSNGDKMVSVFGAGNQVIASYNDTNWASSAEYTSVSIDVGLPFDMALNTWPSGGSDETNTIEMTLVSGASLKSWVINARNYNGCSQDWCVYQELQV